MPTLAEMYPALRNVHLDPRGTGFQAGLIPFLTETSSPRVMMFADHINQALVIDGGEFPMIFAGPEQNLGEYEFSKSRRKQDVHVVRKIPKYPSVVGPMHISHNPTITVVYIGNEDQKLDYFTIDSYTRGSDGFGYENRWENTYLLEEGSFIPKETRLVTSTAHKNGLYCLGVNVNVAYMTLEETIEDAMLISQSVADQFETTEIHEVKIPIRPNQYPLNLYGDDNEIKLIPDIGETVNADGVLCALRKADVETFIPDTTPAALSGLQMHDTAFYAVTTAPPGARIVDISVNASRSAKMPKNLYAQMDKYLSASNKYWQEIISVYNKYRLTHQLSEGFLEHVSKAIQRLSAAGIPVQLPNVPRRPKTKLIAKNGRPIEFMEITVTYVTKRSCEPGFKITGRDGSKGTISRILPDHLMPVDDQGIRAGLVIDPNANIARMTMGPLYEPAINRTSEFVRRQIAEIYQRNPLEAAAVLMDYCNDINPCYEELIRKAKPTEQALISFTKECIDTHIKLWIPVGLDTIGMELIQKLRNKWKVPISPVTFSQMDMSNAVIGTFRTRANVCIGSKYVYLLSKIPESSSSGVAHINQYNVPMKPRPTDKNKFPIRRAPIRFIGEDEGRIAIMDLEDPRELVRLMCLQATSRKGVDAVVDALLMSDFPTRINRIPLSTNELIGSNTIMQVFNHMLATMGLGTSTKGPHPLFSNTEESS